MKIVVSGPVGTSQPVIDIVYIPGSECRPARSLIHPVSIDGELSTAVEIGGPNSDDVIFLIKFVGVGEIKRFLISVHWTGSTTRSQSVQVFDGMSLGTKICSKAGRTNIVILSLGGSGHGGGDFTSLGGTK